MIKKANGKWRKILDVKALNKLSTEFHFQMHDSIEMKQTIRLGDWSTSLDLSSAFHHQIVQAESQPYLAFEFQNNHYTYRAMPYGIEYSPIYFAAAIEPIVQLIRLITEERIISYSEPNQRREFFQYTIYLTQGDRQRERQKQQKTSSEVNRKIELSMIPFPTNITILQHIVSLEGRNSSTEILECNSDNGLNNNSKLELVDNKAMINQSCKLNTNTFINDNDDRCITSRTGFNSGKGQGNDLNSIWNLEQKINEVYKQQQRNYSYKFRPTKFHKCLKEFASSILSNWKRYQYSSFRHQEIESINIINKRNQTSTLNNRKARNSDSEYSPPRIQNEIEDALSRLSREGNYKLKEKIFQQICFQMNLNPTIDLFSQLFNNLLPTLMSTIWGLKEIAIDSRNQVCKKEFPWINSPIPPLPAVLKKIREDKIDAMIIAPLWPGQISYTELVNEYVLSHMFGWNNEILEPRTLLIMKNLKLPSDK
ncbi:MAG: hypothetical protein EZS28_036684, partial [Streblomastix strix]